MEKITLTCPSVAEVEEFFFPKGNRLQKFLNLSPKTDYWSRPRVLKFLKENLHIFKEGQTVELVVNSLEKEFSKYSSTFDYKQLVDFLNNLGLRKAPLWVPFAMRMKYADKKKGEDSQIIFVLDPIPLEVDEYYTFSIGNHEKKGPGIGLFLLAEQPVQPKLAKELKLDLKWKDMRNFYKWAYCA